MYSMTKRLEVRAAMDIANEGMRMLEDNRKDRSRTLRFYLLGSVLITIIGVFSKVQGASALLIPTLLLATTYIPLLFCFTNLAVDEFMGYVLVNGAVQEEKQLKEEEGLGFFRAMRNVGDMDMQGLRSEIYSHVLIAHLVGGSLATLLAWQYNVWAALGFGIGFVGLGVGAFVFFKMLLDRLQKDIEPLQEITEI